MTTATRKRTTPRRMRRGRGKSGIIPIPAKDKDQGEPAKGEHAAEGDDELDNEVAVTLGAEFVPGLGDRAAIAHDAVSEHETAARVEPEEKDDDGEDEETAADDERDDPGRDVVHRKPLAVGMRFPIPIAIPEAAPVVEAAAAEHGCEPGREANHEPLRQIEGLEEDFLGGFKRFAERGEDFDARLAWFHGLFQPVSKGGGKPGCR